MANNLDTAKAISAYEQAMEIRPNYVRTFVNMGIAQNNAKEFNNAATCFLNALILNPKASHIWNYLRTSFVQLNNIELLEKMQDRNPDAFRDHFQLIDPKTLPKPSLQKLYDNPLLN